MLVLYIPLTLTSLFCTTSPSFILPAVRCYFDLTPLEEGSLFGAVYVGKFLNISIVILLVQSWCGTLSWRSVLTDMIYHIQSYMYSVPILYILWTRIVNIVLFFAGMVSSAFVWGFLIDTLGRQKLLFYGILLSGIMEFLSGLVQRFWVLVILKFFCGVA